jgi:hypothetical protein
MIDWWHDRTACKILSLAPFHMKKVGTSPNTGTLNGNFARFVKSIKKIKKKEKKTLYVQLIENGRYSSQYGTRRRF